jgi:selenide,water dikinase
VITTALKQAKASEEHVATAVASMKELNARAALAARAAGVRAVTDVTGFGLLGHAHEMAHLGGVDLRLWAGRLPWLPGAGRYAQAGLFPGGMGNNREFYAPWVRFADGLSPWLQELLWTPETSGGLLAAVAPASLERFLALLPSAAVIGQVLTGDGRIEVIDE